MDYKDLNLSINKETQSITGPNGEVINVLKYLPIRDKIDLIQIALQKAEQRNGLYNQMKLVQHFYLNVVYLYTDIDFSPEDREDEDELFDELDSNGIITIVCKAIDPTEWDGLMKNLEKTMSYYTQYKLSAAALLQSVIQDLPRNAAAAAQIVNNFDPDKYKQVTAFAEAANGGRQIPTLVKE